MYPYLQWRLLNWCKWFMYNWYNTLWTTARLPNNPFSHQINLGFKGKIVEKIIQGVWNLLDPLQLLEWSRCPTNAFFTLWVFENTSPAWVGQSRFGQVGIILQTPSFGWEWIRVLETMVEHLWYMMMSGECSSTSGLEVKAIMQASQILAQFTKTLCKNSTTVPITCLGRTENVRNPKTIENGPLVLPNKYLGYLYVWRTHHLTIPLTAAKCASFVKAVPQAIRNRTLRDSEVTSMSPTPDPVYFWKI
jgi:hypothetical protein